MIKLTDILKEIEWEPEDDINLNPLSPEEEEQFYKQGFRTKNIETDPETGSSTSKVEYLPKFDSIKRNMIHVRNEFIPFKFSSNPDIAKNAKELTTMLTKASHLVFTIQKMIELEREMRK